MTRPIISVRLAYEHDLVAARQRAREIARLLGFDTTEQTRISTALSEIARNALRYAGGGTVQFAVDDAGERLIINVADRGPGIADLRSVLDGSYVSQTGMGLGIVGARRLMDEVEIQSGQQGTTVRMEKARPPTAARVDSKGLLGIADALAQQKPQSPLEEVQQQNGELLRTLEELRRRQDELTVLNQELEETNRGVVALYAELDERAEHLRRADQLKSKFLSHMSHEFRTPVRSTISLCKLMLDRVDGDLTPEQEKQLGLIIKSQENLAEMVNDLLDLAKVEAGKIVIHPSDFSIADTLAALRGMFRPLATSQTVALVIEEPEGVSRMYSDESKVSQILRNLISNALKFTERGEVRVSARVASQGCVRFTVRDTGIGIAPSDQALIFVEFSQVENRLQRKVKGSGLGLPLSKKLAELLGGELTVASEPGVGSEFHVDLPLVWHEAGGDARAEGYKRAVLMFDDSPSARTMYNALLDRSGFQPRPVSSETDIATAVRRFNPAAVVVDAIGGDARRAWSFLAALKENPDTRKIPAVVVCAWEDADRALAVGMADRVVSHGSPGALAAALHELAFPEGAARVLVVDDEEESRTAIGASLAPLHCSVLYASSGEQGLLLARQAKPDSIILDLAMPGASGFDVLTALKADPLTAAIPVIIHSGRILSDTERRSLMKYALAIVSKAPDSDATDALRREVASAITAKVRT